eukprot:CAMPEP_0198214974 /NCGR_PEP_ID=MMETSP1445-20131203/45985_1 /TAXON_ID=36898 /ORGANISM="Pyramimonas sp., Strain CCMP2087" /LENGTH=82 /DNA_ID=CAMNT_0043890449 /DNA_START=15 /DNA_END=258 /DNA_ORIENTATION=+
MAVDSLRIVATKDQHSHLFATLAKAFSLAVGFLFKGVWSHTPGGDPLNPAKTVKAVQAGSVDGGDLRLNAATDLRRRGDLAG